ncbi:gluconokinase [[Pseudomonas] boreopolis]|uniref:gluconokinase n=1 Tax=Xanthomonas boreopolis TaxID=86183 RepID=UPI003D9AF9A1
MNPTQLSPARAIVVMGVSGSGKSTVASALARHYGFDFLDADDFHSDEAKAQMAGGTPLSDEQRVPWVRRLGERLRQLADAGRSSVLAFSGLRREHRDLLRGCGVPMRFVFLHGSAGVIASRLSARGGHFMPSSLLGSQFDALQPPADEPDVIAVDVARPPQEVVAEAIAKLDQAPPGARKALPA